MVFPFRCFSFFVEKVDTKARIQTNTTSTETFYTAETDFNAVTNKCDMRVFTFDELKEATKFFDTSSKIGEGGFGTVYPGAIKSLKDPLVETKVAVKKLKDTGFKEHKQWVTEVNVLGKVEHPNLVKLLGYCAVNDESEIKRLLVYEYMPNGSLEDWLSGRTKINLSWPMRLKVAVNVARGLTYLHEGLSNSIIFRDFKPSNILLDDQWSAKLSDFGCATLRPSIEETNVTTGVARTFGYVAPECSSTGPLQPASDVWSYGVFLYVLITGRPAFNPNLPKNEQNLLEWVKPYLRDEKFELIVDSRIESNLYLQSTRGLLTIANECLLENHKLRPKMSVVLNQLHQHITESTLKTTPPLAQILDREGAIDGQILSHEQQSSTIMKKLLCFPQICCQI